jgi:CRISPR-associated protein Cas1
MSSDEQLEFHLPAPPVTGDTPLVPARMVNEFVYCPRLAYLMWTQGEWSETGDTVEGRRVHARVDRPSAPLPAPEVLEADEASRADKIVSRSLTLSSAMLGVIAKLDVAEAEDGAVIPMTSPIKGVGAACSMPCTDMASGFSFPSSNAVCHGAAVLSWRRDCVNW